MQNFDNSLLDHVEERDLERLAGIFSTWLFHIIFLSFNFSIFISVLFKYGLSITFVSIDNSYYSVAYALVFLKLINRACFRWDVKYYS